MSNSKSGHYFCSRKCKEYAQSFSSDFVGIAPSHYADGVGSYRNIALRKYKECKDCGETKRYLLIVHHVDGDRENNDISNLAVLCANCHTRRHLKFEDGFWKFDNKYLTPIESIKNL